MDNNKVRSPPFLLTYLTLFVSSHRHNVAPALMQSVGAHGPCTARLPHSPCTAPLPHSPCTATLSHSPCTTNVLVTALSCAGACSSITNSTVHCGHPFWRLAGPERKVRSTTPVRVICIASVVRLGHPESDRPAVCACLSRRNPLSPEQSSTTSFTPPVPPPVATSRHPRQA